MASETNTETITGRAYTAVSVTAEAVSGSEKAIAAGIVSKKESEKETKKTEKASEKDEKASGAAENTAAKQNLSKLMSELRGMIPDYNGSWSVFVCDFNNTVSEDIDSHQMQSASLIKLFIMGAIYEKYDEMIAEYGADSIDEDLYYMITDSDNYCADNLVYCLGHGDPDAGREVVNEFCKKYGFTDSIMGRLVLDDDQNGDNYTSVKDCGEFLIQVYRGYKGLKGDTMAHADDMFSLLSQQNKIHKLPSLLPDTVITANKTGELDEGVENDVGIIIDPSSGKVLIVAFMSEDLDDCGDAQYMIGELSRYIYDYYSNT